MQHLSGNNQCIFVFYLIMLNAMGGLLVAVVVKYADNILKGFATSLAIIITCIVSIFLFGFTLSLQFTIGASMVVVTNILFLMSKEGFHLFQLDQDFI